MIQKDVKDVRKEHWEWENSLVNWKPLKHPQMSLTQSSELEVLARLHGVVCHVQEVRNAESWRTGVWVHGFHVQPRWKIWNIPVRREINSDHARKWIQSVQNRYIENMPSEHVKPPPRIYARLLEGTLFSFSARFIHFTHLLTFRRQKALELLVEEMFPLPVRGKHKGLWPSGWGGFTRNYRCVKGKGAKNSGILEAHGHVFFCGGGGGVCKTNKNKSLVTSVVPPFPVTSLLKQLCQSTSEVVASWYCWCSTNLHVSRNLPNENTRPSKQQHLVRYYFWSHLIFGL